MAATRYLYLSRWHSCFLLFLVQQAFREGVAPLDGERGSPQAFLYHHLERLTGCRCRCRGIAHEKESLQNFTIGCHVLIPSTAIFLPSSLSTFTSYLFTYAYAMAMRAGGEGDGEYYITCKHILLSFVGRGLGRGESKE